MLLHRHEHSCCTVMLWTACSLCYSVTRSCEQLLIIFGTVSTNYVMPCVPVSNQLYAQLNTISNRIWICVAIIYHLQIQIKLLSAIPWPLWSCTCDKLISKLWWLMLFCDQSNGKSVTVLYQKVTMKNNFLWRHKLIFYDDSKTMTSAATSLMTSTPCQLPCHCWRQCHVRCKRRYREIMTKKDRHKITNNINGDVS
jgi:hypothetical protein